MKEELGSNFLKVEVIYNDPWTDLPYGSSIFVIALQQFC